MQNTILYVGQHFTRVKSLQDVNPEKTGIAIPEKNYHISAERRDDSCRKYAMKK